MIKERMKKVKKQADNYEGQNTKNKSSTIHLVSALEIQKMDLPDIRWIVPNFLPEGMFILAGRPKSGKSWMALNIALGVAQGSRTMSYFLCNKHDVLYIAYEDNMRRIKDRINILGQHNSMTFAPSNLFFYGLDTFPKINNGGLELLKKVVAERPELKFIVIDTLGRGIEQKRSKNGNHFQDEYEFGAELQKFAISNNICLLVLHHTRKAISDNPYDDIAGTTGLQAAPDGLIILKKNGVKTNLHITGKDIPEEMFEMELDECNWKIKTETRQNCLTPEGMEILAIFEAEPEKNFTPSEIAARINKTPTNISHQLKRLYSENILLKPKYGVYRLNVS